MHFRDRGCVPLVCLRHCFTTSLSQYLYFTVVINTGGQWLIQVCMVVADFADGSVNETRDESDEVYSEPDFSIMYEYGTKEQVHYHYHLIELHSY